MGCEENICEPDAPKTGHRQFDIQAQDIVLGQATTDTQFSVKIKAPKGAGIGLFSNVEEVYDWLVDKVRGHGHDVIVYEFFHSYPQTGQVISDGFVVTDLEHNRIKFFKTGPTLKSGRVINWAIERIAQKKSSTSNESAEGTLWQGAT